MRWGNDYASVDRNTDCRGLMLKVGRASQFQPKVLSSFMRTHLTSVESLLPPWLHHWEEGPEIIWRIKKLCSLRALMAKTGGYLSIIVESIEEMNEQLLYLQASNFLSSSFFPKVSGTYFDNNVWWSYWATSWFRYLLTSSFSSLLRVVSKVKLWNSTFPFWRFGLCITWLPSYATGS